MGFSEEPLPVSGKDCISECLPPLLPRLLNPCGLSFLTCNIRLGEPTSTGSSEDWVSLTQRKPSVECCLLWLCLYTLPHAFKVWPHGFLFVLCCFLPQVVPLPLLPPNPCCLGVDWLHTSSLLALGCSVCVSAIELEVSVNKSVIASRIWALWGWAGCLIFA